jgi:alpha-D-ribose 1-methylphosphonate 5-triphosphate synthase subunit PhnL
MLELKNLSKSFIVHTLAGKVINGCERVSFNVGPGELLGLAGSSGSGKSSILKCIYRTYIPTSGTVNYLSKEFGPVDLAQASEHTIVRLRSREIGYVTQFLKVLPRVPAVDVVAEPLLWRGVPLDEARKSAFDMLARLRIPIALYDACPGTFSGGEQQRVNVARAVIARPRLLLLDEPTASLDRHSVSIIVDILRDLKREGCTMIGIFHDRNLMESVADRIYEMSQITVQP